MSTSQTSVEYVDSEHQKWCHFKGQCSLFLLVVYDIFSPQDQLHLHILKRMFSIRQTIYTSKGKTNWLCQIKEVFIFR